MTYFRNQYFLLQLISSFYDVSGTRREDEVVLARIFRAFDKYEKELVSRGSGPYFGGKFKGESNQGLIYISYSIYVDKGASEALVL